MSKRFQLTLALATTLSFSTAFAQTQNDNTTTDTGCSGLPTAAQLKSYLKAAPTSAVGQVGGLFKGANMWGAVINRNGELCAETTSTDDVNQVWPASQSIARSKAFTANVFSVDNAPMSTARLYTMTQPGQSLWGLGQIDYSSVGCPVSSTAGSGGTTGGTGGTGGSGGTGGTGGSGGTGGTGGTTGSTSGASTANVCPASSDRIRVAGSLVLFGGGVPLYQGNKLIGALGVSGDTSCTDHEVAKRVRTLAGLNPPGGETVDDISYSSSEGMTAYTHPVCVNTFRNGEPVAVGASGSGGNTAATTVPQN